MKTISAIPASKGSTSGIRPAFWILPIFLALAVFTGCATTSSQKIEMVPILTADQEIPEDQLIDVGIQVFESDSIDAEKAKKEGTNEEVRKAERHYIPYHLKNTMQRTSHWGAIRVLPTTTQSAELLVTGKILESNGEYLSVEVKATDATGNVWLTKTYEMTANRTVYGDNQPGQRDPFQNIYNEISNDLVRIKEKMTPEELRAIRKTAQLKFAAEFAPDAFSDYMRPDDKGKPTIVRLPADNDPMMARVLNVRDREFMFVDTMNAQYEKFYTSMWPSYLNWRKLNLDERLAIKKIKQQAMYRQLAGALLIAGAVVLGSSSNSNTGGLQVGMILVGGQVLIDGFNVSKEAEIHAEAIEELGESFGNEMQPVTMEFEGRQIELTGTAEEQFNKWRSLLKQIYYSETGFDPPPVEEKLNEPSDEPL